MKYQQTLKDLQTVQADTSSKQLQHIIDSLPTIVFTLDREGRFRYINQTCLEVWGYLPEELIGTLCVDLVVEEDKEKTCQLIQQLISGHSVIHFENIFRRKEGGKIPISWATCWNANDGLIYCTVRDITERKQLMEMRKRYQSELVKQNQEMSNMLERMTDGFFMMDELWRIVYANRQALAIVNSTFDQIYLQNLWEAFPKAAGTIYETQYRKAISEQVPVSFEAFYPDPLNIWVEINAYPSIAGLAVYFRNITEQKRLDQERKAYEQTIQEQNIRLKKILERITDGFLAVDRNWKITFSNKQGEQILGMSHDQMISKYLWDCFPKAKGTIFETNLNKALSEQVPVYFEAYSSVGLILLELSVYPSDNGLTIFYRDVTERRKTEESIQKLSFIAKETSNAVSLVDLDGKITWINNAYTKITGYTPEEVIGQKNNILIGDEESDALTILQMHERFCKGEPFHGEVVCYTKTKEKIWLDISGQPIYDQMGNDKHYFYVLSDITERKKLERKLERQRKKITAAVLAAQEKERAYVGQELHDNVNQILTTVKLYTELIRDGIGDKREIANKSMELLQNSINEIRSLSKRLSAPAQLNIRFKDSIQELLDSIKATDKISIHVNLGNIDCLEISHELQLAIYRILQEHLTNILKHAKAESVQVTINLREHNLIIKVADDGKGFDMNQKRNGIGITNMITRAENLNGELSINSAPGLGCVLIAQFPLNN